VTKRLTAAAVEKIKPTDKRQEIPDAGSDGLRLIIQPSGAKSWAMRFRRPDGTHAKLTLGPADLSGREGTGTPVMGAPLTLREARWLAAEVTRKRAAGVDLRKQAGETFLEVAKDFITDHKDRRTWADIARMLGLDEDLSAIPGGLAERWRNKRIGEINSNDVHAVIAECIKTGVPGTKAAPRESKNRGRKMGDALGALFKWAARHRRDALQVNPVVGVYRPGPPAQRQRVLNAKSEIRQADELRQFWKATGIMGQPFGPLFRLLLLTGCRLSEIAEMTHSELSDDLSMLHLPGSRTKNGRPHVVYLSPLAREVLQGVTPIEGCPYVFSTNGRTPVSGFSKAKARLDGLMTVQDWRLHDLRSTAATGMAGLGVPPHIVEAALNHVSGAKAGVAGTYNVEAYMGERKEALERWAAHVEGIVSRAPSGDATQH
jgi:hypothetical protein